MSRVPWWVKIFAKIILSRLPLGYSVWSRLNLFRHGYMDAPEYARDVFQQHLDLTFSGSAPVGGSCMEIGPGDSLYTVCNAYEKGFRSNILLDAGDFASKDIDAMAQAMRLASVPEAAAAQCENIDQVLSLLSARYLTDGLQSMKSIPSGSIDFIFSQAVFEHIRAGDYVEFVGEMRRVLKNDGKCSHQIDLRDHLGGGLNNLRISSKVWESELFASSGFYTNRISFSDHIKIFRSNGFKCKVVSTERWDDVPIARRKIASEFQDRPQEDLLLQGFQVILTPN